MSGVGLFLTEVKSCRSSTLPLANPRQTMVTVGLVQQVLTIFFPFIFFFRALLYRVFHHRSACSIIRSFRLYALLHALFCTFSPPLVVLYAPHASCSSCRCVCYVTWPTALKRRKNRKKAARDYSVVATPRTIFVGLLRVR